MAPADAPTLEALNRRIAEGGVKNCGGEAVEGPLQAGLLRQDGKRLYPVRDGIPIMLVEEAIEL